MEKEIWKNIPGFEGLYQASNLGRIRSLDREVNVRNGGKKIIPGRILKTWNSKPGYCLVTLQKQQKKKHLLVHRAVWETFKGPIPEGMQINHINEDKTDNRLVNLNLMTPKENSNWGTHIERYSAKQINGKNSKAVEQYDLQGNFIREWPSMHEIERQLGYLNGNISQNCQGKTKQMYGYVWKYKEKAG